MRTLTSRARARAAVLLSSLALVAGLLPFAVAPVLATVRTVGCDTSASPLLAVTVADDSTGVALSLSGSTLHVSNLAGCDGAGYDTSTYTSLAVYTADTDAEEDAVVTFRNGGSPVWVGLTISVTLGDCYDSDLVRIEGTAGSDTIDASDFGVVPGPCGIYIEIDGLGGADTLHGSTSWSISDIIHGGPGDDTIDARAGYDEVMGGPGNDDLSGGTGDDYLDYSDATSGVTVDLSAGTATGGAGHDTLRSFEALGGSPFGDALYGTDSGESLFGSAGGDLIVGRGGPDSIYGDDVLGGTPGNDTILGGDGDDGIYGFGGDDTILGGPGNDVVIGGDGHDHLDGGSGHDRIRGGAGDDEMTGGTGTDTAIYDDATGGVSVDLSTGIVSGERGADRLTGFEDLIGGDFADLLLGTSGPNVIDGGAGADVIRGFEGDDALQGESGNDEISGGTGADRIHGQDGDDILDAESGNDWVHGGPGADRILAGSGRDTCFADSSDLRISSCEKLTPRKLTTAAAGSAVAPVVGATSAARAVTTPVRAWAAPARR